MADEPGDPRQGRAERERDPPHSQRPGRPGLRKPARSAHLFTKESSTMTLAPYRLVWLALWVEASPAENAAFTEHFRAALAPHGEVVVHARGPFHRTPELLHFEIDLTPRESASACLQALGFDRVAHVWERPADGRAFLHPAVHGALAGETEAATAPRFETGDVVRVRNSSDARELGLVDAEVIVGLPDYDADTKPQQRTWRYSVHVEGQDETEDLAEGDLEPTGRHVQLYGERISITRDGVVDGAEALRGL
ncbi:hypothetical protein OKJ48_25535 [Streptomyces kunmingensis]|uniref:Uncharacterized protein n=1 Tax=Streptomyces kunmingensis TaxID=68225 RepID=A0ABU6CHA9_9ACTN|nr:hypothetical protein [Streptomyces kunmingensis]MEB3963576.1 hypothetical protein [Streptomyces kunmingensis]